MDNNQNNMETSVSNPVEQNFQPVQPQVQPVVQPQMEAQPVQPQVQPVVQPQVQVQQADSLMPEVNNIQPVVEQPVQNKKKVYWWLILIIVAAVAILGFVIYREFFVTGKKITDGIIDNEFAKINSSINTIPDISNYKNMNIDGILSVDTNNSELSEISNYNIKYNAGVDFENSKAKVSVSLNDTTSTLINVGMNYSDKSGYLNLNDLYSKPIKVFEHEIDLNSFKNSIKNDEIIYLSNVLKRSIKNASKDEYFTREYFTSTEIDYKKKTAVKDTFIINNRNINAIKNNIINTFINDEKALEIISNVSSVDTNTLKKYLNSALENEISTEKTIKIEIYSSLLSCEVLKIDFKVDNEKVINYTKSEKGEIITYQYDDQKMKMIINGNKTIISIQNGDESFDVVYEKISNNEFSISTKIDEQSMKVIIKITDDEYNISYTITQDDEYITINSNNKILYDTNMQISNSANYVDLEDITDEDITTILTNLYEKIDDTPFMNVANIGSMFVNVEHKDAINDTLENDVIDSGTTINNVPSISVS